MIFVIPNIYVINKSLVSKPNSGATYSKPARMAIFCIGNYHSNKYMFDDKMLIINAQFFHTALSDKVLSDMFFGTNKNKLSNNNKYLSV